MLQCHFLTLSCQGRPSDTGQDVGVQGPGTEPPSSCGGCTWSLARGLPLPNAKPQGCGHRQGRWPSLEVSSGTTPACLLLFIVPVSDTSVELQTHIHLLPHSAVSPMADEVASDEYSSLALVSH